MASQTKKAGNAIRTRDILLRKQYIYVGISTVSALKNFYYPSFTPGKTQCWRQLIVAKYEHSMTINKHSL